MNPNLIIFALLLGKALLLLALLLSVGLGAYGMVRRVSPTPEYRPLVLGIALVTGPMLMSWMFTTMLYALPGQSKWLYLIVPLVPFAPFLPEGFARARDDLGDGLAAFFGRPTISLFSLAVALGAIVLVVIGLGALFLLAIAVPLNGNDPLEYFSLARYLAETRSGWDYPLTDSSKAGGFVAPWTHPMGYISLLTYGYMLQGSSDTSFVARFVTVYFATATMVLMVAFGGYRRKYAGWLSALFLLSTPVYFGLVTQCHIDPARLATLTAAIAATWMVAQAPSLSRGVLAGLACGCAMFCHSVGVLTLPLAIPIYLLLARKAPILRHLLIIILMIGLSVGMLAFQYSTNIRVFGGLAADSVTIWTYPELGVEHARNVTRLMATPLDRVFNGALMGFTNTKFFGPFFYLLLFAVATWFWRTRSRWSAPLDALRMQVWRRDEDPAMAAALVVFGYMGIMLLTLLAGTDLAVKNARYILTMQPFVVIVVARVLSRYWLDEPEAARGITHG
jgi:hypothetical protein